MGNRLWAMGFWPIFIPGGDARAMVIYRENSGQWAIVGAWHAMPLQFYFLGRLAVVQATPAIRLRFGGT